MDGGAVVIRRALPRHLLPAGAVLFDEAFSDKMRLALPDRDKRIAFMERAYVPDHIVVATRADEMLGMAGLSSGEGQYRGGVMDIPWDPRHFTDLLGWRGAVRAVLGLRLAEHRPARDELYIDGVAVAAQARGQGVGTKLLDEVMAIARESGKRHIRLHVVDTNPRAQALYQRLGFRVTKVEPTGYMELGSGATVAMELPVASAGEAGAGDG
jgi:ribosomal protein S18 acetylase RimI-like enzyme